MDANAFSDPERLREWLNPDAIARPDDDDDVPTDSNEIFKWLNANNPNLPIPAFTSKEEVTSEAAQRSQRIFEDWTRLHNILLQFEDQLRKRWVKKSQDQRKKVLLSAWPNMASLHRPDFQALQRESIVERRANETQLRNEFLFPYINLEDLLKASNLLLFLHSRGHNTPGVFAYSDQHTQHLGRTSTAIQPTYLSGYTMLLSGQTSPETYGKIIAWDKVSDAFEMMMIGIGVQPGEGLLVLEIQEKILRFLVRCAEIILHDLVPRNFRNPSKPISLLEPPSLHHTDAEWASVAATVAELPYRVPMQFDFSRLQSLVNAKRAEAEDHIWLLREDPGYYKSCVEEWSDHRQEQLLSINGKRHPYLGKPGFWNRVLGNVVGNAYESLLMWDLLQKDLSQLSLLRDKFGSKIHPHLRLPEEYEKALLYFSYHIRELRKIPLQNFKIGVFASPPLRSYYVRKPHDPDSDTVVIMRKDPRRQDYFLWLIERFLDDQQILLAGFSELLDELERVTRNRTNSAGSRHGQQISSWVAATLSDLAVLSELERQLEWHQPRIMPSNETEDYGEEWAKQTILLSTVRKPARQLLLAEAGTPLAKFTYPSEKRRTRTMTEKMREAENNLDALWSVVDEIYLRQVGKPLHELLSGILSQRQLERTPEWIEPATTIEQEILEDTMTPSFSNFVIEESVASPEPAPQVKVKVKIKTRGPVTQPPDDTTPRDTSGAPSPRPTIAVTKRAHKVFSSIFYSPTEDGRPGEIPWIEFLHALASAGFAIEKQHGSAWLFTPTDVLKRPIIFHEPHPSSNIPIQIALRHGRRLRSTYGWTAETFAIAQ